MKPFVYLCFRHRTCAIYVHADGMTDNTGRCFAASVLVGVKAGQFKAGGLRNAEHMCKYNELLRIATSDEAPSFVGSSFRKFP